jgi:hypothetical protein
MRTKPNKALKRAEHEGILLVCEVNEAYTSKVYHLCLEQTNEPKQVEDNFSSDTISLWSVLQCTICSHNWDRDFNATNNILNLVMREQLGLDQPQVLIHPVPTSPPPSEDEDDSDDDASNDDPMDIDIMPFQELNHGLLGLNL